MVKWKRKGRERMRGSEERVMEEEEEGGGAAQRRPRDSKGCRKKRESSICPGGDH